jgi:hypothetical protein
METEERARSRKERERLSGSILGLRGDGVNCGELQGSRFEAQGSRVSWIAMRSRKREFYK